MRSRKRAGGGRSHGRLKGLRSLGCRVPDKLPDKAEDGNEGVPLGVGEIMLHVEPKPEVSSLPALDSWITVPLYNHNTLHALVNGHPCTLYVDCGTTSAMIAHHLALNMGLLDKVSYVKNYELQLWSCRVQHRLKVVEDVEVKLCAGVALRCTFLVLPEDMKSSLPDILLDNSTLRQAGAIQQFTASACILHFPPHRPPQPARKGEDCQYVMDVTLKRTFLRNKKMIAHVDTGASFFYVSPRCLHTRLCLGRVLHGVSLSLGKGVVVTSGTVRVAGTDTFDFVIGKEMLSRYRCMLDFASNSLYFHVDEQVFRLKLRKSRTV